MLLSLLNPLTGVVFSFWGADMFHLCVMALVMHEQAGRAAPLQGNMLSKRNQSACRLKKKKKKSYEANQKQNKLLYPFLFAH